MTITDFLPKFIKKIINDRPRQTVTSEYWNELFNLLITQGDWGQEALELIISQMRTNVLFKDNEISWTPVNDFQPATVKFVTDRILDMGGGDMARETYDVDLDGVVNDSDKLGGNLPAFYAQSVHTHADKADLIEGKIPAAQLPEMDIIPINHAIDTTIYGVGSTAAYGHCKTIDSLTRTAYASGEVLSAYQGKVLNDKITAANTAITAANTAITAANTDIATTNTAMLTKMNSSKIKLSTLDANINEMNDGDIWIKYS